MVPYDRFSSLRCVESTGDVGQVDGLHEALIVALCPSRITNLDPTDSGIAALRTIEYIEKPCTERFQVSRSKSL